MNNHIKYAIRRARLGFLPWSGNAAEDELSVEQILVSYGLLPFDVRDQMHRRDAWGLVAYGIQLDDYCWTAGGVSKMLNHVQYALREEADRLMLTLDGSPHDDWKRDQAKSMRAAAFWLETGVHLGGYGRDGL